MPKLGTVAQTCLQRPLAWRITQLGTLLNTYLSPVPAQWLAQARPLAGHTASLGGVGHEGQSLALATCESFADLLKAWRRAMKWTEGLDSTLCAMLASSMSTQFVGEQLWLKIIGPPSSGKTTLMEGLAVAKKWYLSKDTIRGFHSGYKKKDDNEKDVSLALMVNGMTLGTKDGDTLLKAPNLLQILAEGRALYDRVSRTNYRNDTNREYLGHRMTWHLAGTAALREIDDSELGARFLDVVVMDKIDDEFEDEVGWRAANQEARNMLHLSNGKPESQHPEELTLAMSLTGGFLDFLRENALAIAKTVSIDESVLRRCNKLGKFVAFMRAHHGKREKDDNPEREFSPRLVKQFTRMVISLGAVLGKANVDDECCQRVHKVAMDTARGPTLHLVRRLAGMPQGMETRGIAALMQTSEERLRTTLRFLRKIGVTETDVNHKRWRITPRMLKLYLEVQNA